MWGVLSEVSTSQNKVIVCYCDAKSLSFVCSQPITEPTEPPTCLDPSLCYMKNVHSTTDINDE